MSETKGYDAADAERYKKLGIEGTTYAVAFEGIEDLLGNIKGQRVLDYGCGPGRSAKFLKGLGAETVVAVDNNEHMIDTARVEADPEIECHLIKDSIPVGEGTVDAALSNYVFLEIGDKSEMKKICSEIYRVLKPNGTFVLSTVNPESFGHEFKTYRHDERIEYKSGDKVGCTVKTEGGEIRIEEDFYWQEEDFREAFEEAGFKILNIEKPLAKGEGWKSETKIAPAIIFKCRKEAKE